jgi:hypothetical protein
MKWFMIVSSFEVSEIEDERKSRQAGDLPAYLQFGRQIVSVLHGSANVAALLWSPWSWAGSRGGKHDREQHGERTP